MTKQRDKALELIETLAGHQAKIEADRLTADAQRTADRAASDLLAASARTAAVALAEMLKDTGPVYASGLPWRSGYRLCTNTPTGHDAGMKQIAAWRGRKVDLGSTFMGADVYASWGNLASNWVHGLLKGSIALGNTLWSVALPLTTVATARQYAQGANGDFDQFHAAGAKALAAVIGTREVILRLGWEGDHGFPWSWIEGATKSPDGPESAATFRQFWNRIAAIYKNAMPNAAMDFNVLRECVRPLAVWCPENADIVSVDVYDSFSNPFYVDDKIGWFGKFDPATGWAKGPRGIAEYALATGKKWAVPEWGITNKTFDPASKANNADFVTDMFALFQEFQQNLAYECYFQGCSTAKFHDLTPAQAWSAKPAAAYLACYKPPA